MRQWITLVESANLDIRIEGGRHKQIVASQNGKDCAWYVIDTERADNGCVCLHANVDAASRRMGISQHVYDWAERHFAAQGLRLCPYELLSPEAYEMWKKRDPKSVEGYFRDGRNYYSPTSALAKVRARHALEEAREDFDDDFDYEGWTEMVDPGFEQDIRPARLPATPENIARAKKFVMEKWIERARERYEPRVPTDLSNSCKFSSLFAREIFGGRLRGNQAHQFVELADGTKVDLNIDARDVRELGDHAHHHEDEVFWGNPEHQQAVDSCRPRVDQWIAEFMLS
jgi:hypothetical protein